jgi:hypothetical protein
MSGRKRFPALFDFHAKGLQANLANNFFASACDSLRPIIVFGTFPLAIKLVAFGELALI